MIARGYTLLEVLISLVLVSIALLGLAGLQIGAQQAQVETYQRAQAMLLINDMVDRITLNREARRCYTISDADNGTPYVGTGNTTTYNCTGWGTNDTRDLADADMAAWDDLLKGVSEDLGGDSVGGLRGARGCIYFVPPPAGSPPSTPEAVTVTVAWQGESESGVPTDACAADLYGDDDALRRVASDTVRFADLD